MRAAIFLVSAVMAAGPACAAVTFDSASIAVNTGIIQRYTGEDYDKDSKVIATLPSDVVGVSSHSENKPYNATSGILSAVASASVLFDDAASGRLMANETNDVTLYQLAAPDEYGQTSTDLGFSYKFKVDIQSTLTLYWRDMSTGLTVFNTPPEVAAFFSGAGFDFDQTISGTTGGSITSPIFGPGTYQLFLNTSSFRIDVQGLGTNSSSLFALLGFQINEAVPEPASWAMMVGGFGMVGFALRSRRASNVTTDVGFAWSDCLPGLNMGRRPGP